LLVTGTDTDSGKTVLMATLIAYWQRYCWAYKLGVFKPVQSGTGDREFYSRAFELDQTPEQINPLWYKAPVAPPLAAAAEGKRVDLALAWKAFAELERQRDWVLVEGAGGLGSPVSESITVADLASQWRLPAVLVVPVKLGSIAAAVANVALAQQKRVQLKGIVLNCTQPCTQGQIDSWTPTDLIESLTQAPVLGIMPYLKQSKDPEILAEAAAQLNLEGIMPKPFWA
jgi:dethiobiotin synthetase